MQKRCRHIFPPHFSNGKGTDRKQEKQKPVIFPEIKGFPVEYTSRRPEKQGTPHIGKHRSVFYGKKLQLKSTRNMVYSQPKNPGIFCRIFPKNSFSNIRKRANHIPHKRKLIPAPCQMPVNVQTIKYSKLPFHSFPVAAERNVNIIPEPAA